MPLVGQKDPLVLELVGLLIDMGLWQFMSIGPSEGIALGLLVLEYETWEM